MRTSLLAMGVLLLGVRVVFAGQDTISYQGSLLSPGGTPLPDGAYRMQFKLYDESGTNRWQETQVVAIIRGFFSTTLGGSTSLHEVFTAHADLWLEVTVDADQSSTFEAAEV